MTTVPDFPTVSVVMAAYNNMSFVEVAVRSILNQTLRDLELIVVDDKSSDRTAEILEELSVEDSRLRILRQDWNSGPSSSRNLAINAARAPYIAVMDSDDIALPNRLLVQKRYLDAHPDVFMVSGSLRKIDGLGRPIKEVRRPRDAVAVRWFARFNNPLVHPTVMFRRGSAPGETLTYVNAPDFIARSGAEDYEFVERALDIGNIVVLPDILIEYRVHASSLSGTRWRDQQQVAHIIALRRQQADLPPFIVEGLRAFRQAYYESEKVDPKDVFAGLRRMLTHDAAAFPAHRRWMRRQAAQLAVAAFQRSRMSKGQMLRAFLGSGWDFLSALGMRYLETERLLPRPLRSDPDVA